MHCTATTLAEDLTVVMVLSVPYLCWANLSREWRLASSCFYKLYHMWCGYLICRMVFQILVGLVCLYNIEGCSAVGLKDSPFAFLQLKCHLAVRFDDVLYHKTYRTPHNAVLLLVTHEKGDTTCSDVAIGSTRCPSCLHARHC